MATQTTNYGLHKIDLTDAPPDITVLNQNFDIIDAELKELSESTGDLTPEDIGAAPSDHTHTAEQVGARPDTWTPTAADVGAVDKTGDVMSGSLTVMENFNVNKTYDSVEYKTFVRPINYSIASNGDYSTGLIHYKGTTSQAQLMFNKDGVMLRDNVNAKVYQLFGQHNTSTLANTIKSLIDSGVIEVGGLKSPIKIVSGTATTSTVITGTGKGVLHLMGSNSNASAKVTVDGKLLSSEIVRTSGGTISIEFTQSFSVLSGSSSYNPSVCAVFY